MNAVIVRLGAADLAARMAAMRLWLDERRIEPSSFRYDVSGDSATITVVFQIRSAADAFRSVFDPG